MFRRENSPVSQPRPGDHRSDMEIDFEVTYPRATLTVDDPVDISVIATIDPETFSGVNAMTIGFDAAYAYPPGSNDRPGMDLTRTQDNRMAGNTKIYWPIEGKYHANIYWEILHNGVPNIMSNRTVDIITVYPKFEGAQIVNNKVLIDLSIAAYIVGAMGALNIIYLLWTAP